MRKKTIIYVKQFGEQGAPVTVRILWLPDGTIHPLEYWTPDGSCYEIRHIYECTPQAFLKERGEGLRFKVKSELTEMPEPDDDLLHTKYETYLYLVDDWFCGKNIIDTHYGHGNKEFIPVILDVFPDGDYELVYFWVKGLRYMVEKRIEIEQGGSFYAGGVGVCHKVEARQTNANDDEDADPYKSARRPASLYFEINKWFVAVTPAENSKTV